MKIKYLFTTFIFALIIISCSEEATVLSAIEDGEELSEGARIAFKLEQNYPNPFNPSTTIKFAVARTTYLKLSVYSVDWIRVKTLLHKEIVPGYYAYTFESGSLPSGDYYYTLVGDDLTLTRKMKLIK